MDGEGRYTQVTASGTGATPVTNVTYSTTSTTNPLGALTGVTFGSADSDSFSYDPNTGRMTGYTFSVNSKTDAGTLIWNSNGTLGTLVIVDSLPSATDSQTCNYLYDDLQRSSSVNCGSTWTQYFTYDTFGNITKSGSLSFLPIYSATQNQFTSIPGVTVKYDANGNLLTDNLNSYTWDPNWGNMLTVTPAGSATVTATYDALGRMVENNAGGTYTEIIYGPTGKKLATANGQTLIKAFIALPGGAKAIYNSSGLAYYRHSDWLGSSRLTSTQARGVYSSTAYAPFGEPYANSGTADASFTGQDQDTVTSLYDFPARRYSPSQGRWISPDPLGRGAVTLANPQSWNRYAYVNNNPLRMVDPAGLSPCPLQDAEGSCFFGDDDNSGGDDDNSGDPPPVDQCDQSNPNCPLNLPVTPVTNCDPTPNYGPDSNQPSAVPGTTFDNPLAAGTAAVGYINTTTQTTGQEWTGLLYGMADGSFSFTAPVPGNETSGGGGAFVSIPLAPGQFTIIGQYHSHPDTPGYIPDVFSVQDAIAAGAAVNGPYGAGGTGLQFVGTPEGNTLAFVGNSPQDGSVFQVSGPDCSPSDFGTMQGPTDSGPTDVPAIARPVRHF